MSGSIPIVRQHAHIKREKVAGVTKFRWYCSCVRANSFPAQPRSGQWHRQILTVVESFRQHWDAVHKGRELPDWDYMMNRAVVWAVREIAEDDAAGFWVAPSNGYGTYQEYVDKFVNLNTGAVVTGAATSFTYTKAEEKKGMSRLSDIEARLRELEKEAAKYARFPKTDEWPVGTVITYDVSPMPNDEAKVFTYAIIKAANANWYWTGSWRPGFQTGNYDVLVERLADDNVSNIRIATPDDFDPLFPDLEDLVADPSTAEGDLAAKRADG